MVRHIVTNVRLLLDWLYPERQIILRCHGKVTFAVLGKKTQVALSLFGLSLVIWLAYAAISIHSQRDIIANKENHIGRMTGDHERLSADKLAVEEKYHKISLNLESNKKLLGKVLQQRDGFNSMRKELLHELGQIKKQRDLAQNKSEVLRTRLSGLDTNLRSILDQSHTFQPNLGRVANAESKQHLEHGDQKGLDRDQDEIQHNFSNFRKTRQDYGQNLQSSEQMVDRLINQRDQAFSTNRVLNKRIANLNNRLELLQRSQRTLISNIHDRTDENIAELESVIKLTGLDLNRLLKRIQNKQAAVGGPFLTNNEMTKSTDELTLMEDRLTHWSALNKLLERLPITPPVDAYYISSRYGKRKDPFTKRRAFHSGVDLGGVPRSRVYTTSPGTVSFVGWNGPYGRMVEIDHGLGIRTRYGHLSKISVKHAQKVTFRQKIGLMGSSGRSTGAHVHYEVLIDGQPVDPMKFLKAGHYVFKG